MKGKFTTNRSARPRLNQDLLRSGGPGAKKLSMALVGQLHWPKRREGQKIKVNLVRYADDFIITGYSDVFLVEIVRPLVEQLFHERGLALSEETSW